ncbi:hypothetical protein LUZ60_010240 [Juncus effusus]|nr:hypothetical protein LUZ60_010240 [Juncus effusus]
MLLDPHKLLGACGEPADRLRFTEHIQKKIRLHEISNGISFSTHAAANYTRNQLAMALKENPYSVNLLMAGYDKRTGPSLYYIDYMGTLHKIDKGGFGSGLHFCLPLMNCYYRADMSVEEAVDLMDKCIAVIRSRLVGVPPNFVIKIVDKDGAREYAWRESVRSGKSVMVWLRV